MDTTNPPALHVLGGKPAPPHLADDLRCLERMPPEAQVKVWQALGPCLAEKLSKETEQLLDVFCAAYKVNDDDLARAVKGCRFLVHEGVKLDVSAEKLGEDLERLCPDSPLVKEVLLAGYEPARARLRQEIAAAAVAAHGHLLVGADWRVDVIQASGRGVGLHVPVAMLTLQYKDGLELKRITLQVLPDMMKELKGICEQIVP